MKGSSKATKDFLIGPGVIFAGFSSRHEAFCLMVSDALQKNGFEVYPYNPNAGTAFQVKVYRALTDIPPGAASAYVLTNSSHTESLVEELAGRGVRRILFNGKGSVSEDTLRRCQELGVETAVACPMMLYGGGFHKFHGFLSGVRA
jgi:predicted CoA-binding protein